MKRIFFIALVASLLFVGCQQNLTEEQENNNVENSKISEESVNVNIPIFSAEEDKAAAGYLIKEYTLASTEVPPKVILDCDMTYLGDDAMCMCILAQADSLGLMDLLGVTITGGNHFVAYGANSALNQLERIGRADIPVYMGSDVPVNGVRDLEAQEKIVGKIDRWGAMYHFDEYVEPSRYHDLGSFYERKWGYSQTTPQEQNAVDFMIEQVERYKGEVTLIAVGAATNIAMACQKDESFASNTAGIVYMGTMMEEQGAYTPYADFNCFYDAEAYDICLNSEFPKQIVIPRDAAKTAVLDKAVFDLMDGKQDTLASNMWLNDQYSLYKRDANRKASCSDAIAAVVFLNPNVIQEDKKISIQINTDVNHPEYGHAIVTEENGKIQAVMAVNTELYWNFVTDIICHMQYRYEHDYRYYHNALSMDE